MLKTVLLNLWLCHVWGYSFENLNSTSAHDYFPRVIWTFWSEEKVPEDVEEMINITKQSVKNFTHLLISFNNLSKFFNVNLFPYFFGRLNSVGKSDYLRWKFIERYGGIYVDASVFVNSGVALEWFVFQAVNSECEIVCFYNNPWFICPPFFGAVKGSGVLKEITIAYDDLLKTVNPYETSKKMCKENLKMGRRLPCDFREHGANVVANVILKNSSFERKILNLPWTVSGVVIYFQFSGLCTKSPKCVRAFLSCDDEKRKIAFVKILHPKRDGKIFNLSKPVKEGCSHELRRVWRNAEEKVKAKKRALD